MLAAARDLDYHPDLIAQSLRKRTTRTFGMVIPDIANPFFPQLVRGAEDAAWESQYLVITFNTDEQAQRERVAISLMRSRQVDGLLVIAGPHASGNKEILNAAQSGIPTVLLDRNLPGSPADAVLVDNRSAARLGVEEILRAGSRRVAFISGPEAVENARERLLGFEDGMKKAGIPVDPPLILHGDYHRKAGFERALDLLRLASPPDAIFAANGMMAAGVIDALAEFPFARTRHIVIGHFDDFPTARPLPWTVVTVSQPAYEIGFQGARVLLDRVTGRAGTRRVEVRLQATVRIRKPEAAIAQVFAALPGGQ